MDLDQQKEVVDTGKGVKQRVAARGALKWDAVACSLLKSLAWWNFLKNVCAHLGSCQRGPSFLVFRERVLY